MQCSNKVRQLSIATHVYIDVFQVLPPAATSIRGAKDGTVSGKLNSGFIALLTGLEQTALYNALEGGKLSTATNTENVGDPLNTKLAPFICPSDSEAANSGTYQSRISYRFNLGSGGYKDATDAEAGTFVTATSYPNPPNLTGTAGIGPFKVNINDATSGHPGDGFSNTLFFAEKRVRNSVGSGTSSQDSSGVLFASGHPSQTGLNTHAKPGTESKNAGTTLADYAGAAAYGTIKTGYFASSYHTNGVNTVFGDGAGKFINTNIDALTWASLGTAVGGEAATPP
jgi:hypothetical protein